MARPRSVSDEEVLAAAREVFTEHGAKASMDVVAAKVGLSAPALFKRFGCKNDLIVAAMAPTPPKFLWMLLAGPTPLPIEQQLLALTREMSVFFAEMVPRMMVLKEAGISPVELMSATKARICEAGLHLDQPLPLPVIVHGYLRDWFSRANDAGQMSVEDPGVAAQLMIGGIQSRHFMRHINSKLQTTDDGSETFLVSLVSTLLHGIGKKTTPLADPTPKIPPSEELHLHLARSGEDP